MRIAVLGDAGHVDVHRWCQALGQSGADEVHLLSFRKPIAPYDLYYPLSFANLPGKLQYLIAAPQVRGLLKRIKPDLLICYYITGYGFLGTLSGFHPLVQMMAGTDILKAPNRAIMRKVVRYVLKHADLITTLGPHLAEASLKYSGDYKPCFVLPIGIDLNRFSAVTCSRPNKNSPIRIISTRFLHPKYNIHVLIEATCLLKQRGLDVQVTIAGQGPARSDLELQAQRLGISDRIRFVGFVPNDELPAVLAEHNLYVTLVGWDGVSSSLLEAMATRLFPIVPNNPANLHWITSGENGVLLNEISAECLVDSIQRIHSNPSLQLTAWEQNLSVVQERGDMFRNAQLYVKEFRQLIGN